MTPEEILPNDYPHELLQLRAMEKLNAELEGRVARHTTPSLRMAGLLVGTVLLAGALDVLSSGFVSGAAHELYTLIQFAMVAGIVGCLGRAVLVGRRLQLANERQLQAIRDGQLCPLKILNARFEGVPRPASALPGQPVEPRAVVAQEMDEAARAQRAVKALQAKMDQARAQVGKTPALADTVIAGDAQPRRISLGL